MQPQQPPAVPDGQGEGGDGQEQQAKPGSRTVIVPHAAHDSAFGRVGAERLAESDRLLLARMEAECVAAQRLRDFVWAHIAAIYDLKGDDKIENGLILRQAQDERPRAALSENAS